MVGALKRWRVVVLASASALAGCHSYHDDLDALCNAPERSQAASYPPDQRAIVVAKWADGHIHTKQGRDLASSLGTGSPQDKANRLREAAKAEGVSPCPFADDVDKEATP